MSVEKVPVPTDPFTGVPLPILHVPSRSLVESYDHTNFERTDPRLRGLGGRAVRYSLGQMLPHNWHKIKHIIYGPPELPAVDDIDAQFIRTVAGCARLLGMQAIDLRPSDPAERIVTMTQEQFDFETDPSRMHIEDAYHPRRGLRVRRHLGKFFASFAMSRNLSHIKVELFDEFLKTPHTARKRELGNWFIKESIAVAVEPLGTLQNVLYDNGYPHLRTKRNLSNVVRCFFVREFFDDYFSELAAKAHEVVSLAETGLSSDSGQA
jgi:hypothetical protein